MSAIHRSCTSCGAQVQIESAQKGQQAACPHCGGLLAAPARENGPSAVQPDDRPESTPSASGSAADGLLPPSAEAEPEECAEPAFDRAALERLSTKPSRRDDEVALQRLTREERAIRRRRKNLVAFLLTTAALGLALAYLLNR